MTEQQGFELDRLGAAIAHRSPIGRPTRRQAQTLVMKTVRQVALAAALATLVACGGGEEGYSYDGYNDWWTDLPLFEERGRMFTVSGTAVGDVCIEDFYVDVKSATARWISDAIYRHYGPYPPPPHTVWSSDDAGCNGKFSDGPGKIEVKMSKTTYCNEVVKPLGPVLAENFSNLGDVLSFSTRYGCGIG